jgi:hypothetical protein
MTKTEFEWGHRNSRGNITPLLSEDIARRYAHESVSCRANDCKVVKRVVITSDWREEVQPSCPSAANLRGEHISCDLAAPHGGVPHSNREHELIWNEGSDEA